MKRLIPCLYLFVFTCLLMSCSSYIIDNHSYGAQVRPTTDLSQTQLNDEQSTDATWDEIFRNSVDARIDGYGATMKVKIPRLSDSFVNEPLFIVNDQNIGKGFFTVSHINPNSVQRIKVLSRPNEISFYGNQGRHGVILIKSI